MEVKYNVKYKFKTQENMTSEKIKELFNKKWLNIIMILENKKIMLNN